MLLDIKENTRTSEQGSFKLEHEDNVCPRLQNASMLCVRKLTFLVISCHRNGPEIETGTRSIRKVLIYYRHHLPQLRCPSQLTPSYSLSNLHKVTP